MTKEKPTNLAASVRQRLLNIARAKHEDFQLVLGRYGLERLVYRLCQSLYRDEFVLKGATLFQLWTGEPHRSTRDLDLLGRGEAAIERFEDLFREVCIANVAPDGLIFAPDSVAGAPIKPDQEYQGVRIQLQGRLERARIPIQIDVGFGDAISPRPDQIIYPSMLGFPTSEVATYPKETVVAEKLQALVMLGMANTRLKDMYDIWFLSQHFTFYAVRLSRAIRATFERRGTQLPTEPPLAFTDEFCLSPLKQSQWQAFLQRNDLSTGAPPTLKRVAMDLWRFLELPLHAEPDAWQGMWTPGGSWWE